MKKGNFNFEQIVKAIIMIAIILFVLYFAFKIKAVGEFLTNIFG